MKLQLASGYVFEGSIDELKTLKLTRPELFVASSPTQSLTQEEINEFSPEQLEGLLKNGIISNEEYNCARMFWHDCVVEYATRLSVMLELNRIIDVPYKLLRCVNDMIPRVADQSITTDMYYSELERRKRAYEKYCELTGQSKQQPSKDHFIGFANFVVLSNVFKCNKNHHIEQIQATVEILTSEGAIQPCHISAGYCEVCKIYFILETDYDRLSQLGILLCRKLTEDIYVSGGDSIIRGDEFNTESLLYQIGYNVNSQDNLTSQQRQHLLKLAIDNNLYSVSGLLSFLDWLIGRNKKITTRDMSLAISKWEEDRAFVSSYQNDTCRSIGVNTITVRNKVKA